MATQAQVDAALKVWQDAMNVEQTAKTNYYNFKNSAETCQAERDKYSLGWKKNQACDIDLLNQYYDGWSLWKDKYELAVQFTKDKKAIYDKVKAEWDSQIDQQNQQTQQQIALNQSAPEIQVEKEKAAAAQAESKSKNQRYIIIGVVAVIVIIGGIIVWRRVV